MFQMHERKLRSSHWPKALNAKALKSALTNFAGNYNMPKLPSWIRKKLSVGVKVSKQYVDTVESCTHSRRCVLCRTSVAKTDLEKKMPQCEPQFPGTLQTEFVNHRHSAFSAQESNHIIWFFFFISLNCALSAPSPLFWWCATLLVWYHHEMWLSDLNRYDTNR